MKNNLLIAIWSLTTSILIEASSEMPFYGGVISCEQVLDGLGEEKFTIRCPRCEISHCAHNVIGTNQYKPTSRICCSAIHYGAVSEDGGMIEVNHIKRRIRSFRGSTQNNITSEQYSGRWGSYFTVSMHDEEQLIATTPPSDEATTKNIIINKEYLVKKLSEIEDINLQESTTVQYETNQYTTNSQQITSSATGEIRNINLIEANSTTTATSPNSIITQSSSKIIDPHWWIYAIVAGLILMFICVIAAYTWHKKCRNNIAYKRNSRNDEEKCVCYTSLESSTQGLLNDPETCDRPCSKRAKEVIVLQKEEEKETCSGLSNQCDTCTGGCHTNQFDF